MRAACSLDDKAQHRGRGKQSSGNDSLTESNDQSSAEKFLLILESNPFALLLLLALPLSSLSVL